VSANTSSEFVVGILRLRRVVQKSHGSNSAIKELVEVILLEVQRQSQNSHQVRGKAKCGVVVIHSLVFEILKIITESFRPLVGTTVKLLVDKVRVRLGDLLSNVEALLELRLGTLLENLGPQHLVAAVPGVVVFGDLLLIFQ
jgi:hypothetical protein